jgi:hypothetical protein
MAKDMMNDPVKSDGERQRGSHGRIGFARVRRVWMQNLAAGMVFTGMFVACVSTEAPKDDLGQTEGLGDEQLYGEITSGLDSPMWDDGQRQAFSPKENDIDRALSQSPYEDTVERGNSKKDKNSKHLKSDRKVKKASKKTGSKASGQ